MVVMCAVLGPVGPWDVCSPLFGRFVALFCIGVCVDVDEDRLCCSFDFLTGGFAWWYKVG